MSTPCWAFLGVVARRHETELNARTLPSIIARYRRYEGNPPITPVQTRATAFVEPRAWETSRSPRGPMNTCKRRRRDSFQLGLPNSQNAAPIRTLGHWERFLNATPPSRRELVRHMHELNTLVGGAGPGRVQSSAPTQHLSGGIACWRGRCLRNGRRQAFIAWRCLSGLPILVWRDPTAVCLPGRHRERLERGLGWGGLVSTLKPSRFHSFAWAWSLTEDATTSKDILPSHLGLWAFDHS
jgi:hypothetical protein